MKRLSILLALLMLVTIGLVAVGCGGDDTATTTTAMQASSTTAAVSTDTTAVAETTTTVAAGPKTGGTLRVILGPDIQNAGGLPWELWGSQMMAGQFMLESLFVGTPTGEFEPGLAKSYELADDLMSITIELNQGIKFHDGSDFNADVVKWNFEKYMAAGMAPTLQSSNGRRCRHRQGRFQRLDKHQPREVQGRSLDRLEGELREERRGVCEEQSLRHRSLHVRQL